MDQTPSSALPMSIAGSSAGTGTTADGGEGPPHLSTVDRMYLRKRKLDMDMALLGALESDEDSPPQR